MTRKGDHVDYYHGVAVPDPYRWLEDDTSAETAAWVEAQNNVTLPYLERIPFRAALHARVLQLNDYEKYSAPLRKGPYLFFTRNAGLQNQSVLFIQVGRAGGPERHRAQGRSQHGALRRRRHCPPRTEAGPMGRP